MNVPFRKLSILAICSALGVLMLAAYAQFGPDERAQAYGPVPPEYPTVSRPIVAKVFDVRGDATSIEPSIVTANDTVRVLIPEPKRAFRPGRYTLRIWTLKNNVIYFTESSFLWGVLAVNFNKSIYPTGDTADIGITVLDDFGKTVCDADVDMNIVAPDGTTTYLSSRRNTIDKSVLCGPNTVTMVPDFSAEYPVRIPGTYQVVVTATTPNGTRQIADSFAAEISPRFEVERIGPIRIYPPMPYHMTLRVTAHEDFNGSVTEYIPSSFIVSETTATVAPGADAQTLTWPISITSGTTVAFAYAFKAPNVSPELYKVGPAELTSEPNSRTTFWKEYREWQIAADAANTVIIVTSTASTTWVTPNDWNNASNTVEVIGAGGGGIAGGTSGSGGGAGGGYALKTNVTSTAGASITIQIGSSTAAGATGGDTFFKGATCAASVVCAKGGPGATSATGATAVASSSAVGDTRYAGGNGGTGSGTGDSGGGGGGAGGPMGDGRIGGNGRANATSTGGGGGGASGGAPGTIGAVTGGAGGNNDLSAGGGAGGTAVASSTPGSAGGGGGGGGNVTSTRTGAIGGAGRTVWTDSLTNATSGPGGGGGGAGSNNTGNVNAYGGTGGRYGGGGGGGESTGGGGAQGVIIITYTPLVSGPTVSSVLLNNGSDITLTPNTTTPISVNAVVSNSPCSNIAGGTTTIQLYRSAITSSTCKNSPDVRNCYRATAFTASSSCSGNNVNTTTTFNVWYFADATDASSSYASQTWMATVRFRLADGTTSTADTSQELNTLLAFSVPTSSNYGTYPSGVDTSSTNMTITVKNAGNTSTTLKINGTALTTGSASMATSSQHYATSSFTYGGAEQALQEAATTVAGWLVPDPPMGSTWLTTTALPHTLMDTGLVLHNRYIYAIGGYDDTDGISTTSTVRFAALSGDGTVGAWNTSTPLPAAAAGSQIVTTWGNYLYYVGGMTNGTAGRTTVYFTTFNTNGTLNSWSTTTPLTVAKGEHQVFQKDGYIYAIGGRDGGGSYVATSYFARLNATGSISNWSSTAALPTAVSDARGFIKNGYIFSAGGRTGSAAVSTINASLISATGSLNAWAGVGNLPAAIQAQATVLNDDLVYTFGGALHDWSNRTSSVFFATLGGGTTFGDWEQMGNFPVPIDSHASLVANGYLYSAGGEDNSSAVTTVRYLSLSSRDTYWGVSVSSSAVGGNYSSTITYTAIWTP